MLHDVDILYKLRSILIGLLTIAGLLLLTILLIGLGAKGVEALNSNTSGTFNQSSSPNAVQNGLGNAAYEFNRTMGRAARSLNQQLRTMATTTSRVATAAATGAGNGFMTGVHTAGTGATYLARTAGDSVTLTSNTVADSFRLVGNILGGSAAFFARTTSDSFALLTRTPAKVVGAAMHVQGVSSIIQPVDHTAVPTIDPDSPALLAAQKAMAAENADDKKPAKRSTTSHTKPQWPLHGTITTMFGVPEWPFQPIHTGLDISDGTVPGTTPVKPFKPGKVIEVIHSNAGLGNHVIIDHGSGVTSVYGHLNSISVHKGQKVTLKTIVGYEGTTGASTGTHLHLEIRVHGEAADPLKFISGRP